MVKFYVYTSSKDEFEFVEEASIEAFAAHEFDSSSMTYTGILVEAEDFDQAMKVYQNPNCGFGQYIFAEEPQATVLRKQMAAVNGKLQESFNKVHARLTYLRALLKMKLASAKMAEANHLMNEASQELFAVHNNPSNVPPKEIFKRLRDATIEATLKYYGDEEKTG